MTADGVARCAWAATPELAAYHDAEWGVPEHGDRALFELLTLEGAQAGLAWSTVLRKREGYRAAFEGFDPAVVARYDAARIDALARDARIVRHRGKIAATVANAGAVVAVQRDAGSFAAWLWAFTAGATVAARRPAGEPPPARTALGDRVSAELRARGFTFVGPTIVYAFLQAAGVVDGHDAGCFQAVLIAMDTHRRHDRSDETTADATESHVSGDASVVQPESRILR